MVKYNFFASILIGACIFSSLNASFTQKVVNESLQTLGIMTGTIATTIIYGILNDQVTARICPEYFNKGFHKRQLTFWPQSTYKNWLGSDSPTKLGISWGFRGTWNVGLILSIPLAIAARVGSWPRLSIFEMIKPLGLAMIGTGLFACLAGIKGYNEAKEMNTNQLNDFMRSYNSYDLISDNDSVKQKFVADLRAHQMAYSCSACAAIILICASVIQRYIKRQSLNSNTIIEQL